MSDEDLLIRGEQALGDLADNLLVLVELRRRFDTRGQIGRYTSWTEFVETHSKFSIRTIQRRLNKATGVVRSYKRQTVVSPDRQESIDRALMDEPYPGLVFDGVSKADDPDRITEPSRLLAGCAEPEREVIEAQSPLQRVIDEEIALIKGLVPESTVEDVLWPFNRLSADDKVIAFAKIVKSFTSEQRMRVTVKLILTLTDDQRRKMYQELAKAAGGVQ